MRKGDGIETAIRAVVADVRDKDRVMERALTQEIAPAGSGSGTVTSVALTMPAIFSVAGSPVTTAGTLAATLANQSANQVWAGPAGGGPAAPTFRALVAGDIPALSYGFGSVTSVGLSLPAIFSVSGSPVTTTGTLTGTLANQTANYIWAGPTTGAAAAPTFRAMVAADIPDTIVTYAKIQNVTTARLLGRSTAGSGVVEEIAVGAGLTLSAGTLTATGTGTVTSVALSLPAIFSVSGSPITGAGTLTGTLVNQTANYIWAGPTTGAAAAPTFRAMVAADVPDSLITYAKIQNMTTARLLGRTTALSGVVEEIAIGGNLTLTAGVLDAVGLGVSPITTKTADYTLTNSDGTILADPSAGSFAITLPPVSGRTGRQFTIKRISASVNRVYIIGSALEKIERDWYGLYLPDVQNNAITLQCDGVQWRAVSQFGDTAQNTDPVCDLQQPVASSLTSGVSTIDFGTVPVGSSSAAKTFTIKDTGRPNLGVTSASVGGGNSSDFPVNTAGMASVVAYNATTTFAVTFTPVANGARSTTLTVTSTAGTFTVTLTGTGTSSYSWIPWDIFVMASIASGAQPGIGGENSVSWFNSAT